MAKKQKVLVAMSGGVDSSVAAALLLQQGYHVAGATIEMWPADDPVFTGSSAPCAKSAVEDARRVAETLGISHHVFDFSEQFGREVVDNFVAEYFRGRTPNPCVVCNRTIKFGAFLEAAETLGFDLAATGHYARISFDPDRDRFLLKRAKDDSKDQTYVLYSLNQRQFSRSMFPLGGFSKAEIRQMAEDFDLPVAHKEESQEICFIPDNDYRRFLSDKSPGEIQPGSFVDIEGNTIGRHRGLPFYTIGQRRGLGLALGYPAYVVAIDVEHNTVVVGPESKLYSSDIVVKNNNFIPFDSLEGPLKVEAKIRYNSKPSEAEIRCIDEGPQKGDVQLTFTEPQRAVTPGQSAVYYLGDTVIGGGIIYK